MSAFDPKLQIDLFMTSEAFITNNVTVINERDIRLALKWPPFFRA